MWTGGSESEMKTDAYLGTQLAFSMHQNDFLVYHTHSFYKIDCGLLHSLVSRSATLHIQYMSRKYK